MEEEKIKQPAIPSVLTTLTADDVYHLPLHESFLVVDFRSTSDFQQHLVSARSFPIMDTVEEPAADIWSPTEDEDRWTEFYDFLFREWYTSTWENTTTIIVCGHVDNINVVFSQRFLDMVHKSCIHYLAKITQFKFIAPQTLIEFNAKYPFLMTAELFPDLKSYPAKVPGFDGLLYIGSIFCLDQEVLKNLGIERILNVAAEIPPLEPWKASDYLHLPMYDAEIQPLPRHTARAFLDQCVKDGKRVLVHCAQGRSRSADIVLDYMKHKLGLKFTEAISLLRTVRHVYPNWGFVQQLAF